MGLGRMFKKMKSKAHKIATKVDSGIQKLGKTAEGFANSDVGKTLIGMAQEHTGIHSVEGVLKAAGVGNNITQKAMGVANHLKTISNGGSILQAVSHAAEDFKHKAHAL